MAKFESDSAMDDFGCEIGEIDEEELLNKLRNRNRKVTLKETGKVVAKVVMTGTTVDKFGKSDGPVWKKLESDMPLQIADDSGSNVGPPKPHITITLFVSTAAILG